MPIASRSSKIFQVVPFEHCPAKTWVQPGPQGQDRVIQGRSVLSHCTIVAHVAQELIARLPPVVQALYPKDAAFAAGCHDIGKVSPYFYEKLRRALTNPQGLPVLSEIARPEVESQWGGHAGVSQVAAAALGAAGLVPAILGQHHGSSPPVARYRPDEEIFGGQAWQAERARLVAELMDQCKMGWPNIADQAQARLVAGLTTVSDWIGSGRFFEDPEADWHSAIKSAVDDAGFVTPAYRSGLRFEDIFGFSARPSQQCLIDSIKGPGVYVLEASMGLGKTEAALYAAYRMLETGKASGIYFALPTQLTSNNMFGRFEKFLEQILAPTCLHRPWLIHGSAWLMQTQMGEDARPGGAWFNQSKRGLLAPFGVGTIDQALMAAMRVKHGFVRAFGLAGKVVILDEVHSYDIYTGSIMDAMIALLRELGCTVIILSATLYAERIRQMVSLPSLLSAKAYPLITAVPNEGTAVQSPVDPGPASEVSVRVGVDKKEALSEAIDRAARGECVLWIENTVGQAQERFGEVRSMLPDAVAVGLLHSRFTPDDRQAIEKVWVKKFGKEGWEDRPGRGCVLVGTQVLEQSLDLDSDFMVSAFAPTDLLLQRLGRLWRHTGTPRAPTARRECWIVSPSIDVGLLDPLTEFGSSAFVYSPYVLCRSLQVWSGRTHVRLPHDVRPMVEATYASVPDEAPELAQWKKELDDGVSRGPRRHPGRKALRGLAANVLSDYGRAVSDEQATTRYTENDTTPTLLVRSLHADQERHLTRVVLLSGKQVELPWSRSAFNKERWRQVAVQLSRQVVNLPMHEAPQAESVHDLRSLGLGHVFYLGEPEDPVAKLRVGLVQQDHRVVRINRLPSFDREDKVAVYRSMLGYQVQKKRE